VQTRTLELCVEKLRSRRAAW